MSSEEILFVVLGAAAGGFINGLAAFGTALFALGFFLTVMSPVVVSVAEYHVSPFASVIDPLLSGSSDT